MTGLKDITGKSFTEESKAVLSEIGAFLDYQESSSFPKTAITASLYTLLRERLLKLSKTNEIEYENLIRNDLANNKIENFLNLEGTYYEEIIPSPQAYEDVTLATIHERDA